MVSPAELMAARLVLEPALIAMVIGNATAADFDRMDACNHEAEAASTLEAFEHWDAALHEAIAEATHNRFITGVFRLMSDARAGRVWRALAPRRCSSATPSARVRSAWRTWRTCATTCSGPDRRGPREPKAGVPVSELAQPMHA